MSEVVQLIISSWYLVLGLLTPSADYSVTPQQPIQPLLSSRQSTTCGLPLSRVTVLCWNWWPIAAVDSVPSVVLALGKHRQKRNWPVFPADLVGRGLRTWTSGSKNHCSLSHGTRPCREATHHLFITHDLHWQPHLESTSRLLKNILLFYFFKKIMF